MKHLFTILAAILLASCASTRYASTYDESRDSTRVSTRQLDSIFARLMQRDSIYIRDSIYVREKGDTVTKYVERVRYQYKVHTDTLYKYRTLRDTVYMERRDSIRVERPVYIEKPRRWYETGLMWAGGLCCIAAIMWALFLYLKRKF